MVNVVNDVVSLQFKLKTPEPKEPKETPLNGARDTVVCCVVDAAVCVEPLKLTMLELTDLVVCFTMAKYSKLNYFERF